MCRTLSDLAVSDQCLLPVLRIRRGVPKAVYKSFGCFLQASHLILHRFCLFCAFLWLLTPFWGLWSSALIMAFAVLTTHKIPRILIARCLGSPPWVDLPARQLINLTQPNGSDAFEILPVPVQTTRTAWWIRAEDKYTRVLQGEHDAEIMGSVRLALRHGLVHCTRCTHISEHKSPHRHLCARSYAFLCEQPAPDVVLAAVVRLVHGLNIPALHPGIDKPVVAAHRAGCLKHALIYEEARAVPEGVGKPVFSVCATRLHIYHVVVIKGRRSSPSTNRADKQVQAILCA
ncbi:hypothetical protein B0H19DRAFT_1184727 [Mycena capillaripes]|nr:hypothetical protein B0H19DRAFT_1184727 [Mycena capillaripes]